MRLRQVCDEDPGIRRVRSGSGFSYRAPSGKTVSAAQRRRIERLAIPPAWQDVWICTDPRGHVQATGRDARDRKQYVYHKRWSRDRAARKFGRMEELGARLPALRASIEADLARPGLPKEKVVASVVRIIESTFLRVGGERYAQENGSFGASTLESAHVRVTGRHVRMRFPGKGGKQHDVALDDAGVARVVQQCRGLPGRRLFEFRQDGTVHTVTASDINHYIAQATEGRFTSKDLRTWCATTVMLADLVESGPRDTRGQRMAVLRRAVRRVAGRLHNTPAVCRRSYIHPAVPAAYFDGSLQKRVAGTSRIDGLWPQERRLVALLRSYRQLDPAR